MSIQWNAFSQPSGKGFVEVTEEDASPSCFGYQIKFANTNVTDNGDGTCSVADQTGAGGGDEITVNTTAATNANFLDNLYMDWAINIASTPDDITAKFNYAETLAGNPAFLTTECAFTADGLICEGTTADLIEIKLAFPDPVATDKTITLPNATDTLVGKDTTDTLTNKTMTAAANVIDADTAVALAADPADCATSTHFAVGVVASGAATCEAIGDADIPDTVTVTGWVLGTSSATSFTSPTLLTDLIDGVGAVDIDLGSADITDFTVLTDGGTVVIDGNITQDAGTTLFMGGLLDATGAVDMDYGSADITDHTFIADGGTVIIDGNINSSTLTASEILITDGSKNIVSAAVATYPSLTELTYVKGVTSAIQTQLTAAEGEGSTSYSLPIYSAKLTGAFVVFTPPTADACSQGAQIDAGDGNWRLLYDATTDECATWQFVMPNNYSSTPLLDVMFSMASGEANEVEFEAAVMCYTPTTDTADIGTASFSNVAVAVTTVSATAGEAYLATITLTDDACAAGDIVFVVLSTDANDATNDDATGDREVVGVNFRYTGS